MYSREYLNEHQKQASRVLADLEKSHCVGLVSLADELRRQTRLVRALAGAGRISMVSTFSETRRVILVF